MRPIPKKIKDVLEVSSRMQDCIHKMKESGKDCKGRMGSTRTTYNGQVYDSIFESEYAYELDMRVRAKEIKSWERQIPLELAVNGWVVTTYKIDFLIHHNDGTKEYVETKGWATPSWKLKWKLFTALYEDLPRIKVTLVKQVDNWNLRPMKKAK